MKMEISGKNALRPQAFWRASFKELLMANSIQVDALAQLMIRKGFITQEEFFDMLEVQAEYGKKEPI
jgi:hypothetical protein